MIKIIVVDVLCKGPTWDYGASTYLALDVPAEYSRLRQEYLLLCPFCWTIDRGHVEFYGRGRTDV